MNGQPLRVCGVNRHEWHEERMKAVTEEDMLRDIRLLKRFHFNAVRPASATLKEGARLKEGENMRETPRIRTQPRVRFSLLIRARLKAR